MAWTAPSDHAATVVSVVEWNNFHGTSGNCAYLKAIADAPMKAQKDGGSILGGRAKLNFIQGTNMVVTVADAAGDDRINVTLASSGGTSPTIGTDISAFVAITDPGSYPNWSGWTELIASTAAASLGLALMFLSNSINVKRWRIGTGASPAAVLDLYAYSSAGIYVPLVVPFAIAAGTKISAQAYYAAATTPVSVGLTVLS